MSLPSPTTRAVLAGVGWLLVVLSVVTWRSGVIYAGGVDPVVVGKALVALVAAACAAGASWHAPVRRAPSIVPAVVVAAIVAVSLIGAVLHGGAGASAVLSVRLLLAAVTVVLLLRATSAGRAVALLLGSMGAVGLVAGATGAVVLVLAPSDHGRLGGGIPQLAPNELAGLLLPVALGLVALLLRRGPRVAPALGLVVALAMIALTQSRTSLAIVVIGAIAVILTSGRLSRRTLLGVASTAVVVILALTVTGVLGNLLLRGRGLDRLLSLNTRTTAWSVLFDREDPSGWLVGHGLSLQTVRVHDFVNFDDIHQQPFDSSWVSSLAQSGLLGTALLLGYAIVALVALARLRPVRPFWIVLAAAVLLRSLLENGLLASSTTFLVFFALATIAWPVRPRPRGVQEAEPLPVETGVAHG